RTELLFLEAMQWPSHDEQVSVLRPVLARLQNQTATVRLFDFGGDKTPPFLRGITARGIAVMLNEPQALKAHLSAVVDAGRGADQLSVAAARVGQVRQWVRELDFADCRRRSEALLGQSGHTSRQRV